MIREFTMLAKLFQEFHPIGAAPKHAVAHSRKSKDKRIKTTYHFDLRQEGSGWLHLWMYRSCERGGERLYALGN